MSSSPEQLYSLISWSLTLIKVLLQSGIEAEMVGVDWVDPDWVIIELMILAATKLMS